MTKTTRAIYPGSFDPPTWGHVNIVQRTARIVDHLIIGVAANATKQPLFDATERVHLWQQVTLDLDNVTVMTVDGLVADFCRHHHADFIVKGVRNEADVASEITQAHVNRALGAAETLLMPCHQEFMHISSTIVKDVAHHGGDVSQMVPPAVVRALHERFTPDKENQS